MSNMPSDLEEGEIIDDPPSPPPPVCPPKIKKLPRRYNIKDGKSQHKKTCKHHNGKLKKIGRKKSPYESHVRSSKQSSRLAHSSKPVRHYSPLPTKNCTPSLETIKLKSILDLSKLKPSNKPDSKLDVASCDFSEISAMYEEVRSEKMQNNLAKTSLEFDDSKREVEIKSAENKHIINSEKEESEDEEELRRIALSTCMVGTQGINKPEMSKYSVNDVDLRSSDSLRVTTENYDLEADRPDEMCDVDLRSSDSLRVPTEIYDLEADRPDEMCEATSSTINLNDSSANNHKVADWVLEEDQSHEPTYIHPPVGDNYEVIDMELDDDNDDGGLKSPGADNLFIIDTKPSLDSQTNSNSATEKQSVDSDDDFELDILRAELIENMYRSSAEDTKSRNLDTKASFKNHKKPVSHKFKRHVSKRPPTSITRGKVTKCEKRLIITLNAESSDESDENEDAKTTCPENPVASIEALISDIRQKSDEVKEVPEAVSCLSKAQQEEYNALMKILEKKKPDVPEEAKATNFPVNNLKVMEEKLFEVSELLKAKKLQLQELLKDMAKHKQAYMKSKLTAQLLKEQFIAAEKVRRLKLQAWSNCCRKYEVVKKTVAGLEFKTNNLRNLCSSVGSGIYGQSCSSPNASSVS